MMGKTLTLVPILLLTSCKISKEIQNEDLLAHIDEISSTFQNENDFYFSVKFNDKVSDGNTRESRAYSQALTYKNGLGFYNLEREKINDLTNSGERIRIGLVESKTVYEYSASMDKKSTKYYYSYDENDLPDFTYNSIEELTFFGIELFKSAVAPIEIGTNTVYFKTEGEGKKEMTIRSSTGKISYTTYKDDDKHFFAKSNVSYTIDNVKYIKTFSVSYGLKDSGNIQAPGDLGAYTPKPTE